MPLSMGSAYAMSVWKEIWDDLSATPAQAGPKAGSMWFAAPRTVFVGFVSVSYMFLKVYGWLGWIFPVSLACAVETLREQGEMWAAAEGQGRLAACSLQWGLERSWGALRSCNPDGKKRFPGALGETSLSDQEIIIITDFEIRAGGKALSLKGRGELGVFTFYLQHSSELIFLHYKLI